MKKPRSLSLINSKLVKYKSVDKFEADVRLMFDNCIKFNEPSLSYEFSDQAINLWNTWLENRKQVLFDAKAMSTASTVKKSTTQEARKRNRTEAESNAEGSSSEKKSTNIKRRKREIAIMDDDDEEEEFTIDDVGDKDLIDGSDDEYLTATTTSRKRVTNYAEEEIIESEADDSDSDSEQKKMKNRTTMNKKSVKGESLSRPPKSNKANAQKRKSTSTASTMAPMVSLSSMKLKSVPSVGLAQKVTTSQRVVPSSQVGVHAAPPPPAVIPGGVVLSREEKIIISRNMLRWSVALFRDAQLHAMFKQHLCDLLLSLEQSPSLSGSGVMQSLGGTLPIDDKEVEKCLWMCQAGVDYGDSLFDLKADRYLLREALPFLMHHHLTRDVDVISTRAECAKLLQENLDLQQVTFGADKACKLLIDLMLLLLSSKIPDTSKR